MSRGATSTPTRARAGGRRADRIGIAIAALSAGGGLLLKSSRKIPESRGQDWAQLLLNHRPMNACSTTEPRCNIAKTARGWRLMIQNEHFSVMQVFRSEETAREAVDRMMEFFDTMSTQPPPDQRAA